MLSCEDRRVLGGVLGQSVEQCQNSKLLDKYLLWYLYLMKEICECQNLTFEDPTWTSCKNATLGHPIANPTRDLANVVQRSVNRATKAVAESLATRRAYLTNIWHLHLTAWKKHVYWWRKFWNVRTHVISLRPNQNQFLEVDLWCQLFAEFILLFTGINTETVAKPSATRIRSSVGEDCTRFAGSRVRFAAAKLQFS